MSVPDANFDLEDKNLSLIDFCSEDDCLYVSPPRDHPHLRFSEDQKGQKEVQFLAVQASKDYIEGGEEAIQLFESSGGKKTKKNEKYNLRKSLAWDNAFFTSAGVLEPEELSTMMCGVKQGQKRFTLPEIEEEICRSSESICTLATEKSTLGTLEEDLFGDTSASIQKSSKACQDIKKAGKSEEKLALNEDMLRSNDSLSTLATDNSTSGTIEDDLFGDIRASIQKSNKEPRAISQGKLVPGVTASQVIKSSEKVGTVSQNKLMTKAALKKPIIITKGTGKMMNKVSPSAEASKRGLRTGEPAPSLSKPPKIIARANSLPAIPTKRASSSSNSMKVEKDNVKTLNVPGRGTKFPANGASRFGVPKPLALVKSSLRSSVASKTRLTPSSSIDSLESLSSSSSKYSSEIDKLKIDSKTNKCSSITSTVRTGSMTARTALRNRNFPMKSLSKPSSSISPASSTSEWSSESLSPSSTLNNRSNISRPSIGSSSWKNASSKADVFQASGSENRSNDNFSAGKSTRVTGLMNKSAKRVSTGSGALNHPEAIKPSGLRMPSPKIGFFDGAKSMVRTPTGSLKSPTASCNLPRSGPGNVSPGGGLKETRREKLQPARTVMAIQGTKAGAQKIALETQPKSPLPLQEASNISPKVLSGSRAGKTHPGVPFKVQNKKFPKKDEEYSLHAENIATNESNTAISNLDLCDSEKSNGPCKVTISSHGKDKNSGKFEEIPIFIGGSTATCHPSSRTEQEGEFCCQKNNLKPTREIKSKSPSPKETSNLSPRVCSSSRTGKHSPVVPLKVQIKKSTGKDEQYNLNVETIAAKESNNASSNPESCDSQRCNSLFKDKLSLLGAGNNSKNVKDILIADGGSSATCNPSYSIWDEVELFSHKNDSRPASEVKTDCPIPLEEASNLSLKVFSGSKTEKHSPGMPLKVQNKKSSEKDEQCKRNDENIGTAMCNPGYCSTERSNSKDKMSSQGKGNDSANVEGISTLRGSSATCNSSSVSAEEGELCDQKRDLNSFSNSSKKEKNCIHDEIDGLAQQLEALNIVGEIQQKPAGNWCPFDQVNVSADVQPGGQAETLYPSDES